jgi:hypothetical protein
MSERRRQGRKSSLADCRWADQRMNRRLRSGIATVCLAASSAVWWILASASFGQEPVEEPPEEAEAPEAPSDLGSGLLSGPRWSPEPLTGDWFGARSWLADRGSPLASISSTPTRVSSRAAGIGIGTMAALSMSNPSSIQSGRACGRADFSISARRSGTAVFPMTRPALCQR